MASLLGWLKAQAKVESVLLIAHEDEAKRILVCWTMFRPKFKDVEWTQESISGTNIPLALEILWAEEIDYDKLARLANVKRKHLVGIFERLREALLVFPDGTVSDHAKAVITAEAAAWLRPLIGQSDKR